MQRRSWLTPAETRLAGLLFLLSLLGGLVRLGERVSPAVDRWLTEAGGPAPPPSSPAGAPADTLIPDAAPSPRRPAPAVEAVAPPPAPQPSGGVDPNAAGLSALIALPGVGPALARRILADRERNGPYRRPEDLLRVRGIGPATLDKMRPRLRF